MATIHIQDSREGIEANAISIGGILIKLDVPQRLSAYEIMRLSQTEDVYLTARDDG